MTPSLVLEVEAFLIQLYRNQEGLNWLSVVPPQHKQIHKGHPVFLSDLYMFGPLNYCLVPPSQEDLISIRLECLSACFFCHGLVNVWNKLTVTTG